MRDAVGVQDGLPHARRPRAGAYGGTGERFDWELAAERIRGEPPLVLSGGLTPENVAEAIATSRSRTRSTSRAASRPRPGVKDPERLRRFFEAVERRRRRTRLMAHAGARAALRPLRRPLRAGDADAGARGAGAGVARRARGPRVPRASSTRCCATTSAGRRRSTTPSGCPSASARRVYLKREDLLHTGAHKINNALGQALLAQRMGKRRMIAGDRRRAARRRDRDRVRAARARVRRLHGHRGHARASARTSSAWGCWARRVRAGRGGARTLKEAVSAAIRDWVANVATTHYIIGSAVGPAPYPALVRDLQRVIGDEARAQMLEQAGRLPDRVVACVGGGSNAIGTFHPFVADDEVELVGVEAGGEGLESGRHGASLARRQRRRTARRAVVGAAGRRRPDRRGALGLGRARLSRRRARARLPARHRPRPLRVGDRRRGARPRSASSRGSRASSRRSSRRTRSRGCSSTPDARTRSRSSPSADAATRTSPRCSRTAG